MFSNREMDGRIASPFEWFMLAKNEQKWEMNEKKWHKIQMEKNIMLKLKI